MKKPTPWELVEAVLPLSRRVLLYGVTGTGKSWTGSRTAVPEGGKVFIITVTEDMSVGEIRGHYVPQENQFVWVHGPGIQAWVDGARLVINEIDKASGDVKTFLHALLDDPEFAGITLPNKEFVRPAEGFQVIATMNGAPEDLEDALRDRFPVTIEIMEPNPEAIKALPEDLRDVARKTCTDEESRRISIRSWAEFAKLRMTLPQEIAAVAVFRDRAEDILNALKITKTSSPGGD